MFIYQEILKKEKLDFKIWMTIGCSDIGKAVVGQKDKYRHHLEGVKSRQDTEAASQRVWEAVKRMENQNRALGKMQHSPQPSIRPSSGSQPGHRWYSEVQAACTLLQSTLQRWVNQVRRAAWIRNKYFSPWKISIKSLGYKVGIQELSLDKTLGLNHRDQFHQCLNGLTSN